MRLILNMTQRLDCCFKQPTWTYSQNVQALVYLKHLKKIVLIIKIMALTWDSLKQLICFILSSLFDRKPQTQPGGGWRFWSDAGHSNTGWMSSANIKLRGTVHSFFLTFYIFNGIKNENIWTFSKGKGEGGRAATHVWDMEFWWTWGDLANFLFVFCAVCTDGRFFAVL